MAKFEKKEVRRLISSTMSNDGTCKIKITSVLAGLLEYIENENKEILLLDLVNNEAFSIGTYALDELIDFSKNKNGNYFCIMPCDSASEEGEEQ